MKVYEPSYLALLRHGESEGDVRRLRQRAGEAVITTKTSDQEGLTSDGWASSEAAGLWVKQYILGPRGWSRFDSQQTSPSPRCVQTAHALDLGEFGVNALIEERHRGDVRGLSPREYEKRFPDSYAVMLANPLYWQPPGPKGESIGGEVAKRVEEVLGSLAGVKSALFVTHRDNIWTFLGLLEGWEGIDTDKITNNTFIEYSSLDPITGVDCGELSWVRWSHPEIAPPDPNNWSRLGAMATGRTNR